MADAVTLPGGSGTQVTISGGGDSLGLAQQISSLLSDIQGTISGASDLSVTAVSDTSQIPQPPQIISDEPTGTAADVDRLYQGLFNRVADSGGLSAWTSVIDSSRMTLAQVADAMTQSSEFTQGIGRLSDLDFVRQLYQNMFGRDPEGNSGQAWASVLASGASRGSVAMSIAESAEAKSGEHPTVEQKNDAEIFRLYETAFGRSPDSVGETAWSSLLANGVTVKQVAADFTQSAEWMGFDATLDDATFIRTMYNNALGRDPEDGASAAWLAMMTGPSALSRADVLLAFADSGEAQGRWAPFADDGNVPTNELVITGDGGLNESIPGGYNYVVVADAGADTLSAANAGIVANDAGGTFFLSGVSTLSASGGDNVVTASGNYLLSFGDGNNLINANGSGLISTGMAGASTVFASGGTNTIQSNGNGDVVQANSGQTAVIEAGDNGTVTGVGGTLTVTISGANDQVIAGTGATTVDATAGSNVLVQGGDGPLSFVGGVGGATIIGGVGGSTVFGGSPVPGQADSNITFNGPNDLLYVAAAVGNATLNAANATGNVNATFGDGDDTIIVGSGSETLNGGAGSNQYFFDQNSTGANTIDITDTSVANDSFTFANYTGAPVVSVNGTGHVQVALSDGSTIVFTNLTDPNAVTGRLAP